MPERTLTPVIQDFGNKKEMIMGNYTASTFGESIADQYDSLSFHVDPNQIDRLCERWGGWDKQTFTGSSAFHVSIYGK